METSKWISLEGGHNENKARLEPIPDGPYCLVYQHDMAKFEADPHSYKDLIRVNAFKMSWGYGTYCVGPEFKPLLIAHWYDCSD